MNKFGILCLKNCKVAKHTLLQLAENEIEIDLVIIENDGRSKLSTNEKKFNESNSQLNKFLLKRDIRFFVKKLMRRLTKNIRSEDSLIDVCLKHNINFQNVRRHSSKETQGIIMENKINYLFLTSSSWLIKEVLLDNVFFRIINIHNAELPNHKGLHSMMYGIINDKKIVLTAHFVDKGIDTGDILYKQEIPKKQKENILELQERLNYLKSSIILKLIKTISSNKLVPIAQDINKHAVHNPMSFTELVRVNEYYQKYL